MPHVPEPFRLTHANPKFAPARFHLQHREARWPDVYVAEEDLPVATTELPLHLHVPPVWTAFLQLPQGIRSARPADWAWGFLKARELSVPPGGRFVPVNTLDAERICAHPQAQVRQARQLGFLGYCFYLQAWRDLHPVLEDVA